MGDYINANQQDYYWQQTGQSPGGFYEQDYSQFTNQQLGKVSTLKYSTLNFSYCEFFQNSVLLVTMVLRIFQITPKCSFQINTICLRNR